MKFSVSSTSLYSALTTVSRVQNPKNSLDILNCILFILEENRLSLVASDSENTIITSVEVNDVEGTGRFAILSRQLLTSLKEISEQPVTFIVNPDTFQVEITYLNGRFNMVCQNGNDYPLPQHTEENQQTIIMPAVNLLDGLSRCLFAAADDELRPQMNGIFFDLGSDYTTLVASDGHKLVRNRILTCRVEEPTSFILPKKPSLLLKNILPHDETPVSISFDGRNAEIQLEGSRINCRLIEGRYPNYNSVIPQDNPFRVTIDRQSFISAVRRVSVFASQSNLLLKLALSDNSLTVSAQDIDFNKSAEERITCEYSGNQMSIGFSGPFLHDVLNNINGTEVVLELADPSRAGLILPKEQSDEEDVVMLLMPMMLQD